MKYKLLFWGLAGLGSNADSTPGGALSVVTTESGNFSILMEGGVNHVLMQGAP